MDLASQHRARIALLAVLVVALVALLDLTLPTGLRGRCLSVALFDVTCPGCGVTRALVALVSLDVPSALRLNPAVLLLPVSLGAQLAARSLAATGVEAPRWLLRVAVTADIVLTFTLVLVWAARPWGLLPPLPQ